MLVVAPEKYRSERWTRYEGMSDRVEGVQAVKCRLNECLINYATDVPVRHGAVGDSVEREAGKVIGWVQDSVGSESTSIETRRRSKSFNSPLPLGWIASVLCSVTKLVCAPS
jgi:hypothetical protein